MMISTTDSFCFMHLFQPVEGLLSWIVLGILRYLGRWIREISEMIFYALILFFYVIYVQIPYTTFKFVWNGIFGRYFRTDDNKSSGWQFGSLEFDSEGGTECIKFFDDTFLQHCYAAVVVKMFQALKTKRYNDFAIAFSRTVHEVLGIFFSADKLLQRKYSFSEFNELLAYEETDDDEHSSSSSQKLSNKSDVHMHEHVPRHRFKATIRVNKKSNGSKPIRRTSSYSKSNACTTDYSSAPESGSVSNDTDNDRYSPVSFPSTPYSRKFVMNRSLANTDAIIFAARDILRLEALSDSTDEISRQTAELQRTSGHLAVFEPRMCSPDLLLSHGFHSVSKTGHDMTWASCRAMTAIPKGIFIYMEFAISFTEQKPSPSSSSSSSSVFAIGLSSLDRPVDSPVGSTEATVGVQSQGHLLVSGHRIDAVSPSSSPLLSSSPSPSLSPCCTMGTTISASARTSIVGLLVFIPKTNDENHSVIGRSNLSPPHTTTTKTPLSNIEEAAAIGSGSASAKKKETAMEGDFDSYHLTNTSTSSNIISRIFSLNRNASLESIFMSSNKTQTQTQSKDKEKDEKLTKATNTNTNTTTNTTTNDKRKTLSVVSTPPIRMKRSSSELIKSTTPTPSPTPLSATSTPSSTSTSSMSSQLRYRLSDTVKEGLLVTETETHTQTTSHRGDPLVRFNVNGKLLDFPMENNHNNNNNNCSLSFLSNTSTSNPNKTQTQTQKQTQWYPTVSLRTSETTVWSRFYADDINKRSRSSIGAPPNVRVYALDGSLLLSEYMN